MTSVEIPYSIASALPSLTVLDITNEVRHELRASGYESGIAYVSPLDEVGLVRVQERETGFFEDLENLLERIVPTETPARARMVATLLGTKTEQVPFSEGCLCLGQWQRVMLFSLDAEHHNDWSLTLIG